MVYDRLIYGCGPYMYESVRDGSKVHSIYLGKGTATHGRDTDGAPYPAGDPPQLKRSPPEEPGSKAPSETSKEPSNSPHVDESATEVKQTVKSKDIPLKAESSNKDKDKDKDKLPNKTRHKKKPARKKKSKTKRKPKIKQKPKTKPKLPHKKTAKPSEETFSNLIKKAVKKVHAPKKPSKEKAERDKETDAGSNRIAAKEIQGKIEPRESRELTVQRVYAQGGEKEVNKLGFIAPSKKEPSPPQPSLKVDKSKTVTEYKIPTPAATE